MSLIRLGLLGPLEVSVGGVRLERLHQPKQQAVFAMMAVNNGRTVPLADLIGGVWGGGGPPSALSALRNYMSSLRRIFRRYGFGGDTLCWAAGGYRLDAEVEADAAEAERLLAAAETARASGQLELAADGIRAGLRLWRGEALSGIPGPWAAGERARLHHARETLRRRAIEISIEQRDFEAAIARLETLVHAEPRSEQWRMLLMTALSKAGRRVDALETYRATREWFIDTMGLEPSPAMTELQRRILAGASPTAANTAAPAVLSVPERPVPSQLPPDTGDFTGRTADLMRVTAALSPGRTVSVVAVSGMGGVGKTALAVHVGHQVQVRFPDGRLYVDLRATKVPPDTAEVLAGFLRALGVPASEIPAGVAERSALFRTVARGKRLLVVLDDAASAEQLSPLLPASAGCAVLVTARALTALPVARRMRLTPMEPTEAAELFTRIVADARPAAEPEAVRRIVELCGGLPLAIRIIAARLVARPGWTIADEADRLAADRRGLRPFRFRDTSLESAFQSGYDQLDADLAQAFRVLARLDRPEVTAAAVAAALGCEPGEAMRRCDGLVDRGMLDSPAPGRYRCHELVRVFARGRPDTDAVADVPEARRVPGLAGAPHPTVWRCVRCAARLSAGGSR